MSDTLCNEKKKPYTFSEDGNSCIITETRTPRYWYNYLWNENHYCAQISQTGHGRSYYLSEKADMCMMNQDDARYIYLRDEKSKECWNIGEGPLNTEVENYQCVHSIGSSRIQSSYQNIASSWRLFVPEEGYQEVWTLKIKKSRGNIQKENKKYRGKTAPSQHIFSSQLLSGGLFLSAIL